MASDISSSKPPQEEDEEKREDENSKPNIINKGFKRQGSGLIQAKDDHRVYRRQISGPASFGFEPLAAEGDQFGEEEAPGAAKKAAQKGKRLERVNEYLDELDRTRTPSTASSAEASEQPIRKEDSTSTSRRELRKPSAQVSTSSGRIVSTLSTPELFVAGMMGGFFGKTITAPIDRVRILYQVNPNRPFSLNKAIKTGKTIWLNSGISGLWRGNGATVMKVMPSAGIQFSSFSIYDNYFRKWYKQSLADTLYERRGSLGIGGKKNYKDCKSSADVYLRFCSGALAGSTATMFTYPFDLVRARMAAHWAPEPLYNTTVSGIVEILKGEGPIGLFRGVSPTLIGIVPYAGMSFMIFETSKERYKKYTKQKDIPIYFRLLAGGCAGLVGQVCSYPLHVVRRRMQIQKAQLSPVRTFMNIYTKEGVRGGLFKGMSLTFVKGPLGVAVSFAVNDCMKNLFASSHHNAEDEVKFVPPLPSQAHHVGSIKPRKQKSKIEAPLSESLTENLAKEAEGIKEEITGKEGSSKSASSAVVKEKTLSAFESLCCGSVAGACAKTVIAPADRVKILYQTNPDRKFSWGSALKTGKKIYTNQGFFALWRGNFATMVRVCPYAGISFTMFPRYVSFMKDYVEEPVYHRFLAGALAGMTATSITYPLDLMRARMAAHWGVQPYSTNYMKGFTDIIKKEGVFKLWSGLRPTLMGNAPYAGISFMIYETLKARFDLGNPSGEHPVAYRLAAGASAGLIAQSLTYPFDIVRRRMQVGGHGYRNEFHAMTTIYTKEGLIGGLFKGLSMNYVKGPIAVAISFTVNDFLKHKLSHNVNWE